MQHHTSTANLNAERQDSRSVERKHILDNVLAGQPASISASPTGPASIQSLEDIKDRDRYATVMQLTNDGFWEWDLEEDRITFSPRWQVMLGYNQSEITDDPSEWFTRIHPADLQAVELALQACRSGSSSSFELQHRIQHRSGEYRWVSCRATVLSDANGRPRAILGAQTDITTFRTHYSTVTKLPSRTLFMEHVGRAMSRTKRNKDYQFAVLFLDLDRFRNVNESLGHVLGDRILVTLAERLEALTRASDIVAHLGGDEFAVLLEDIRNASDATRVAERIKQAVEAPFELDEQPVFLSISVGIALSQDGYERPEELLRDADIAMNRAKGLGRACYAVFDHEMHEQAVKRLKLEADLRRGLAQERFEIHYQPILSLQDCRLTHVEALIRWNHPERGFISPFEFISVAEETGLIVPMGEWVLRTACAQIQALRQSKCPALGLAVNISARQFQQRDLLLQVREVLTETGLPPDALVLEITESTAMQDVSQSIAILEKLASIGVKISVDDFGTGYSSLEYLKRLPLHYLKIDRSFVKDIPADTDDAAITAAISAMAHTLHLTVVAEGIETEAQLEFLRSLGCAEGQGYLFSKPISVTELTEQLAKRCTSANEYSWCFCNE